MVRTKVRTVSKAPNHKHTQALMAEGYSVVVGVDEVGRGSWAGPVTAAAVILPDSLRVPGARDSKLLSFEQREQLAPRIKRLAAGIGLGWASSAEVDRYGLTWAVRQSGLRALEHLAQKFDAVMLDGNHNYLKDHYFARAHIKADDCCLNVACASIVAKVARDNYMAKMDGIFPGYGFASNKGYGTPAHQKAMRAGLTPLHRRLFAPVAQMSFAEALGFYESLGSVD